MSKELLETRLDTLMHIKRVSQLMSEAASELLRRGSVHDLSKLSDVENEGFSKAKHQLADVTYGSEEYKAGMVHLKETLRHHYAHNSHHPEHYENGIDGMDLFDILEMFFDWKASGERHPDGCIYRSIEINKERFKLSEQLINILNNTAKKLGYHNFSEEENDNE